MNQVFEVDEGRKYITNLLPQVIKATDTTELVLEGVDEGKISFKLGEHEIASDFYGNQFLKKRFDVDSKMLVSLEPELREKAWKSLTSRAREDMFFKVRDGKLLAIADEKEKDCSSLFFKALDKIAPTHFANVSVNRDKLQVGLVTKRYCEPRVGDHVAEGIMCTLNGKLRVAPYHLRLVCSNGAVSLKTEKFVTVDEDNYSTVLDRVVADAHHFTENLQVLDAKPLPKSPANLIAQLSKMKILSAQQTQKIVESVLSLEGGTEYDLINLITQQQHESRDGDISWLIAGGLAISHFSHCHCSNCGAVG